MKRLTLKIDAEGAAFDDYPCVEAARKRIARICAVCKRQAGRCLNLNGRECSATRFYRLMVKKEQGQ